MSSKKYELKEFQDKTAKRIFHIFHDEKQNRVLLADEVGLGKTIVAKAVIDKVYKQHQKDNPDKAFKVVYICSNAVIARQNIARLQNENSALMSVQEGRLPMQHLCIARQEANSNDEQKFQLLPMTPTTSFSMTQGYGTLAERAVMYCILQRLDYFKGNEKRIEKLEKLEKLLGTNWCTNCLYKGWEWNRKSYKEQIDDIHKRHKDNYPDNLHAKLDEELQQMLNRHNLFQMWDEYFQPEAPYNNELCKKLYYKVVPKLRSIFADLSVSSLQPDLVIMDEFQRFRSLVTCKDESDMGKLRKKFLENGNTKVLLVSATPYTPYTTLAEMFESNTDEHSKEFMEVIKFLLNGSTDNKKFTEFQSVWREYSMALKNLLQNDWHDLLDKKKRAEEKLHSVLCRTERQNNKIIKSELWEKNDNAMDVSEGDLLSYYNLIKIIQQANRKGANIPSVPIEYVKSSPYLLSFMRSKYKVHKKILDYYTSQDADDIPTDNTSFLDSDAVNNYELIPPNNARLQTLYNQFAPEDKHAELLLWVPPSHPYYSTNSNEYPIGNIYDANKGFSKLLLFSAWEMVPRMTAAMLSYEMERRIFSRLSEESPHYKIDTQNISRPLTEDYKELLTLPSTFLADIYTSSEFEGKTLTEILSNLKNNIKKEIDKLKDKFQIPDNDKTSVKQTLSANQTLLLLKLLEIHKSGKKDVQQTNDIKIPEAIPADTAELLAYMAVASPAVCALRTLKQFDAIPENDNSNRIAKRLAEGITGLFNTRNAQAIIKLAFKDSKKPYYFNVLRYCAEGNFQAMLDEYAFVCGSSNLFIQNMAPQKDPSKESPQDYESKFPYYISSSHTIVDTIEAFRKKNKEESNGKESQIRMRTNFAMGYYNTSTDKTILWAGTIRTAFNMPFRPFVLATTSIGQEGLDFHVYCRKIMHWNLPQNPIDLEQREGRINRYMSLAIRQSLANSDYADNVGLKDFWNNLINKVKEGKDSKTLCGGMVPYWILPIGKDNEEFEKPQFPIERIVPAYPYSKDQDKYNWIIKVLSMYRLTLGQPNQEELLRSLDNANIPEKQLKKLFFNLSPFFGKQEKKRRWRRPNRFSIFFCRSPFGRRQKKRI